MQSTTKSLNPQFVDRSHWCYRTVYAKFHRNRQQGQQCLDSSANRKQAPMSSTESYTTLTPTTASIPGIQSPNKSSPTGEEEFECHELFDTHSHVIVKLRFWLEGVLLSLTGKKV